MTRIHPLTGLPPGAAWPLRVSSRNALIGAFGWTRTADDGTPKQHKGVDWCAKMGHAVFCAHEGRVHRAGLERNAQGIEGNWGYGSRLVIRHDASGVETVYGHLSGQAVAEADRVFPGQLVGWVGCSGNAGPGLWLPHLHFEVREAGEPVNPEWWLHGLGDRLGIPKPRDREA